MDDPERVIALDLETTGKDPDTARIVELCLIRLDEHLEVQGSWTQRVNPSEPISPGAVEVHGITEEDVADCPTFDAIAARVQRLVEDAILLVYNADFDVEILHRELREADQAGLPVAHPVIDALEIFRDQFPHTLENAVRHYLHRDHDKAHTAQGDARALVDIFKAQRLTDSDLGPSPSDAVVEPERSWLDRGKRLYEDEGGVARFGFGRYEGDPVVEHPDYVREFILDEERGFPAGTRQTARQLVSKA